MDQIECNEPPAHDRPVRITVATVEISAETARCLTNPDELRRAIAPLGAGATILLQSSKAQRPAHASRSRWSPLVPFATMRTNYRVASQALGASGRASVAYVCVSAGLASVVWRHYTLPIGIGGGLVVAAILFVRTGAYREYLAAIESAHGVPALGAVVRYNLDCVAQRIRVRWRR
jgi:hypothetical protein